MTSVAKVSGPSYSSGLVAPCLWLSPVYFSSLFSHGVAYSLFVLVLKMFNPFAECLFVSLLSIYCLYMYVSLCYLICSPILDDNK